jgi:hypothetical protein
MKIIIKPIDSRFKRLIHDFGNEWIAIDKPFTMNCFNGQLGVTCHPANNAPKLSNFKLSDIEVVG